MTTRFRTELFTETTEYEEEPLRDRKSQIPNLRRDDKKAEFVRDVIALANTARMFGRPAYLLYGLENDVDERYPICGLGDSLAHYGMTGTHDAWESLKQSIERAIAEYIQPQVQWELVHNQVNGQQVAYLRIDPLTPPSVFCTAKNIQHEFDKSKSWIRFGESKRSICRQDISPDDDRYRYAYSAVPYVLPRIWKRYFESILSDRNPAENLVTAQDIKGYQDLYVIDGQLLQKIVDEFLNGNETLLIIEGAAGSGKSAYIQRWVAEQAEAQLQAVEVKIEGEEFTPPTTGGIPVYHRLRNEPVRANYCLGTRLLDAVNKKSGGVFWQGRNRPSQVQELLHKPELHWVICLDGLDEIRTQQGQEIFLECLRDFLETYSSVKVILTTRPDAGVGTLRGIGEQITIAAFSDEQVTLYLQNWAESEEFDEFVAILRSDPELWELCKTPAFLEAACKRLSGKQTTSLEPILVPEPQSEVIYQPSSDNAVTETSIEVPKADERELVLNDSITDTKDEKTEITEEEAPRSLRIGEVLYEMYAYLWQREYGRCAGFRPDKAASWWEKIGLVAIKMDGGQLAIRTTGAQRELGSAGLHHILSLGILKRTNTLICFNTELTKAYFAAAWLGDCLETNDMSKARRLLTWATADFCYRVRDLLEPLTAQDIQPLFQEVNYESV